MDRRTLKKLETRRAGKQRQRALTHSVQAHIEGGDTFSALRRQFTKSVLNSAFAHFSHENYTLLEKALGPAASDHKILIDECVNPALLRHAHQLLGATRLSSLAFGKSVKDPDLYPAAQDQGYGAILSCDAVSSGERALCGIAKAAFTHDPHAPLIVLVPQDITRAVHALRSHSRQILENLEAEQKSGIVYNACAQL